MAGYCGGMLPIFFSVVGMFWLPRPEDKINRTLRDISECDAMISAYNFSSMANESSANLSHSDDSPFWHRFFWVAPVFTGPYCLITFSIVALPVCYLTHDERSFTVDSKLHVSLFQSSIWPRPMRKYFKIDNVHLQHSEQEKITIKKNDSAHLLLETSDEKKCSPNS